MMADLKGAVNPIFLSEEYLRQSIELLFFGYRDFTGEADRRLDDLGLGRAHHRAIYFIGRNPSLTVSQLLSVLKITKQSLSRVLQELIAKGYVAQHPGATDRRQRLLKLTAQGEALERQLTEGQRQLLERAFAAAGADAVDGFRRVLLGIVDDADRQRSAESQSPGPQSPGVQCVSDPMEARAS